MMALRTWISRPSSRLLVGLPLVIILLLFAGCSNTGSSRGKKQNPTKKGAVPVEIGLSTHKTVPVEIRAVGTVEPYATVAIKSQVTGIVQSIHFKEGDDVITGSPLFTIDPRPFSALLDQAQGTLARDRAELANAQKEVERYLQAAGKGYVSLEQAEQAQTKAATLSATVKADMAAVENARLQVEFCSITSPLNGRTGELLADRGNLIKANADTAMVTINQISPIKVSFSVPATNLQEIKKYQASGSLTVQVLVPGTEPLTGTFSFLDNTVDPTTGTIRLKAEFANRNKVLWPGAFVDVRLILTERENSVVVPSAALQSGQKGAFLYVVKPDKTVEERKVTAGMIAGDQTVIENGLQAGESVVIDGQLQLTDGSKIEPRSGNAGGTTPEAAAPPKEPAYKTR